MSETPNIHLQNYSTTALDLTSNQLIGGWMSNDTYQNDFEHSNVEEIRQRIWQQNPLQQTNPNPMNEQKTPRRLVQVFIADANENVPLEKSLLYRGELKLTDLNDTELFFEIPITELLKTHNEQRTKWLDKDASRKAGKDIFLEPVKIRELQMRVVNVAQF